MLDLCHIYLSEHDVARFATKRQAAALAKDRGWRVNGDVIRAFNRFNIFWVVGERLPWGIRLATNAHGTVELPYRKTESHE